LSSPDGYRATLSCGELYLQESGRDLLIADRQNGKPLDWGGKFAFIPAGDLMSDRDVKALEKIEVVDLRRKPQLAIIGIGSGDTDLITMEAVTAIARADALICTPDIRKRFGKYLGEKPILLDFYEYLPPRLRQKHADLSPERLQEKMQETWRGIAETIKSEIQKGKTIALLDYGDPTIWSATEYLRENFDPDLLEIIPGLSSFNVASALLERHTGCRGAIILANGRGILENKPLFKVAAEKGETLSVFLGRREIPGLVEFFNTVYAATVPVSIVFEAGYSGREKVVRTDLRGLSDAIKEENDLFLLFLGPCLDAKSRAHRH